MATQGDFKHISVSVPVEDEVIQAGLVEEAPKDEPVQSPTPQPAVKPVSKATEERPSKEAQRELEELDVGPMTLTQKVVIIAAIALILVAVVYFFLFMG